MFFFFNILFSVSKFSPKKNDKKSVPSDTSGYSNSILSVSVSASDTTQSSSFTTSSSSSSYSSSSSSSSSSSFSTVLSSVWTFPKLPAMNLLPTSSHDDAVAGTSNQDQISKLGCYTRNDLELLLISYTHNLLSNQKRLHVSNRRYQEYYSKFASDEKSTGSQHACTLFDEFMFFPSYDSFINSEEVRSATNIILVLYHIISCYYYVLLLCTIMYTIMYYYYVRIIINFVLYSLEFRRSTL